MSTFKFITNDQFQKRYVIYYCFVVFDHHVDRQWPILMVDELHDKHPYLTEDPFWDHVAFNLPHTTASIASVGVSSNMNIGSADNLRSVSS